MLGALAWLFSFSIESNKRHPEMMGEEEINTFLSHLATAKRVSASTQNQALAALLFLDRHVLHRKVGELTGLIRARRRRKEPVVLTPKEVRAVLAQVSCRRVSPPISPPRAA